MQNVSWSALLQLFFYFGYNPPKTPYEKLMIGSLRYVCVMELKVFASEGMVVFSTQKSDSVLMENKVKTPLFSDFQGSYEAD